jgi:hypothetical protein
VGEGQPGQGSGESPIGELQRPEKQKKCNLDNKA